MAGNERETPATVDAGKCNDVITHGQGSRVYIQRAVGLQGVLLGNWEAKLD